MRLKRVVQTLWSVCYPYIFIMMADCFFVIKKRPEEYCLLLFLILVSGLKINRRFFSRYSFHRDFLIGLIKFIVTGIYLE